MASFNRVLLMGNLTHDVELKYTNSNLAVANLRLAVNRRFKTADGERREETLFIDCEAWGRTAENVNEYFSKGKPIFVEGRLKLDEWTDADGNNRSKIRVVIERFEFIDSRSGNGNGGGGGGGGRRSQPAPVTSGADNGGGSHEPISEDEIPF